MKLEFSRSTAKQRDDNGNEPLLFLHILHECIAQYGNQLHVFHDRTRNSSTAPLIARRGDIIWSKWNEANVPSAKFMLTFSSTRGGWKKGAYEGELIQKCRGNHGGTRSTM